MNLLYLQYFCEVASEQSFTRAAKKLNVSQSSVSKAVRSLEEQVGSRLLERTTRQVALTATGLTVFRHGQRVFGEVESLRRTLLGDVVAQREIMRIGTTDSLAARLLAPLLADWCQKSHPIYPVVRIGAASELVDLIDRRKLDGALLFHAPDLPPRLGYRVVGSVRHHLVCAKASRNQRMTRTNFLGSREVDDESTRDFPVLRRWRQVEPDAVISLSSNSLEFQLAAVLAGAGIAILPDFVVAQGLREGQLVDLLPKERIAFRLKWIFHQGFEATVGITEILGYLANRRDA